MREGWPSLTALAVAVARGIGTAPEEVDRSATFLVPRPIGRALALIGHPSAPSALRSALRIATLGLVDHVSLRRAAIDRALHEAIASGTTQLVVLGAGLDGRAWRLDSLHDMTVFEVDHPATQEGKRRRVTEHPSRAAELRFVAVDFERDSLSRRLAETGHDRERATVWIWEGVTPYLHPPAIQASLVDISERSAQGSRLIVSYAVPQLMPWDIPALDTLTEAGFAVLGEPLRGAISTEDFANLLIAHDFAVLEDTGNREWATRHRGSSTMARLFSSERLAVAER